MKVTLTKSKAFGDGYFSTLTNDNESICCKPISDYEETVESLKRNKNLRHEIIPETIDFEQGYLFEEKL